MVAIGLKDLLFCDLWGIPEGREVVVIVGLNPLTDGGAPYVSVGVVTVLIRFPGDALCFKVVGRGVTLTTGLKPPLDDDT